MGFKSLFASAALLVASAAAQQDFATHTDSGRGIAVRVPTDTANSGSGSIYFQITAPSGTQWLAFGQGSQMNGANMFVIYSSGSDVVLSPRSGKGHNMPEFSSSISAELLPGSGLASDGSMVANIKCDSCLSWSGGSMKATDTSSSWIMAYKNGDAIGSSDTDATISRHDSHSSFSLDLTKAVADTSSNPFQDDGSSSSSASASASGSATASSSGSAASSTGASSRPATASASATNGVSQPIASSNPNSGSSSSSSSSTADGGSSTDSQTLAHGVIMSVLFLACFPFFALTLYLPTAYKVRYIHAPLQVLSVILLIVGMALGIVVGQKIDELDTYHQVIGYIIVALLVLVQPVMGLLQHLHFHKSGTRSTWGLAHQALGRGAIMLGIVNGGLGFQLAGNTGAYVPYAVVAVIVALIYVAVVLFFTFRSKRNNNSPVNTENKTPGGYEMQHGHHRLGSDSVQQTAVQPKQR